MIKRGNSLPFFYKEMIPGFMKMTYTQGIDMRYTR